MCAPPRFVQIAANARLYFPSYAVEKHYMSCGLREESIGLFEDDVQNTKEIRRRCDRLMDIVDRF